ncbi:hypothetical protein RRG08_034448 [Elysia crispata]|uniref:Uncharacterized protein n=1 Tax=Elysia crispata TaxID=231223 RepID=A0AAE0XSG6_9GAST|nr:hypothetical protein RRG08_034448 [Elysia crispata]
MNSTINTVAAHSTGPREHVCCLIVMLLRILFLGSSDANQADNGAKGEMPLMAQISAQPYINNSVYLA